MSKDESSTTTSAPALSPEEISAQQAAIAGMSAAGGFDGKHKVTKTKSYGKDSWECTCGYTDFNEGRAKEHERFAR